MNRTIGGSGLSSKHLYAMRGTAYKCLDVRAKSLMNKRIIRGFAIAPLAPCLLSAVYLVVVNRDIYAFAPATAVYALFSYSFALVFGVPAYSFMSKAGKLSLSKTIVAGTALGAMSAMLLLTLIGVSLRFVFTVEYLAMATLFSFFGAVTAWIFWLLALRPDGSNNAPQSDASRRWA